MLTSMERAKTVEVKGEVLEFDEEEFKQHWKTRKGWGDTKVNALWDSEIASKKNVVVVKGKKFVRTTLPRSTANIESLSGRKKVKGSPRR